MKFSSPCSFCSINKALGRGRLRVCRDLSQALAAGSVACGPLPTGPVHRCLLRRPQPCSACEPCCWCLCVPMCPLSRCPRVPAVRVSLCARRLGVPVCLVLRYPRVPAVWVSPCARCPGVPMCSLSRCLHVPAVRVSPCARCLGVPVCPLSRCPYVLAVQVSPCAGCPGVSVCPLSGCLHVQTLAGGPLRCSWPLASVGPGVSVQRPPLLPSLG